MTIQRCTSTNRHGQPCRARAIKRGKCAMHSGLTDPRQMGRAGGLKASETQIRRELKQDDAIRAEAKDVIRRGLAGDESISKTMLDAARSVFSFRAASPPDEPRETHRDSIKRRDGRPVTGLADVLEIMLDRDVAGSFFREPRFQAIVDRMAARVAEARATALVHENGSEEAA